MFASDFQAKLHKLNSKLKIYCGNDSSKPAGLYYVINGEYIEICGIDKNEIPQYPIYDDQGHIIKSGWNRTLQILVKENLIDRKKAETLFDCHLIRVLGPKIKDSEIKQRIKKAEQSGGWHKDDLAEIGSRIK